jgi:integrase
VPPTNLPFTFIVKGRYWQFRRGKVRGPLPGEPGDPAFHSRYAELKRLSEHKPAAIDRESFTWLIGRYRASEEFKALRAPTRLDYDKTLDLIDAELGKEPFRLTTRPMVKAVRDSYAATPRKAHKVKQMVSRLYSWADENDLVPPELNPAKMKRLKVRAKTITPWSEEEIALFLAHCPAFLKTPVMLALYTGQRREDVAAMTWDTFQGAFIRVRQSKTGTPLDIACHRDLRAHLVAVRTSFGGPIARTMKGRPFTANSLSQAVRRVIESIEGMPKDRSLHGLRYAAAGRLDEAGVGPTDASEVMGHRTYQMAMKYLAARKRSAAAIERQEKASQNGETC